MTPAFGEHLFRTTSFRDELGDLELALATGEWEKNPTEPFYCSICIYASDELMKILVEKWPGITWSRVTTRFVFQGVYRHDFIVAGDDLIIDPTLRQFFYPRLMKKQISQEEFESIPRIFVGKKSQLIELFKSFGIMDWVLYFNYEFLDETS